MDIGPFILVPKFPSRAMSHFTFLAFGRSESFLHLHLSSGGPLEKTINKMQLSVLAGTVVAGFIACYLLDSYFLSKRAPSEPVAVRARLPLVGHLLSLMDNPSQYFRHLDAQMPGNGAFMISIFGFKLYAVTDRKVVLAVQRAAKSISFVPFSNRATVTLSRLTPESGEIYRDTPVSAELKAAMNHGMLPGLGLDSLNLAITQETLQVIDMLAAQASQGEATIDLLGWIKHSISLAASGAWFGPKAPFRDPNHETDWWYVVEGT